MRASAMVLGQQWLHDMWFTKPNSEQARDSDWLFMFILWVSIISFVVLMGAMTYFVVKYRRRPGVPTIRSAAHNTPLELGWSIGPLLVLVPIFFWGFHGYISKQAAPANAEIITVIGEQWRWAVSYDTGVAPVEFAPGPSGSTEVPVIVVPEGRPIKLIMTSKDVIHAFFIPDFRTKIDVFPNRFTSMWFKTLGPTPFRRDARGEILYDSKGQPVYADHYVFCAEYCGENHSEMAAFIRVLPEEQYQRAKAKMAEPPEGDPVVRGRFFWEKKYGCKSCHSADGSAGTGPTWKNMYGYTREFSNADPVDLSDDTDFVNYIRESVYQPQAKLVKGYGPQMNTFLGQVKPEELLDIAAFIRTLSDKYVPPEAPAENGGDGAEEDK